MWFKLSVWKHYISYVTSIIYFFFFLSLLTSLFIRSVKAKTKTKKRYRLILLRASYEVQPKRDMLPPMQMPTNSAVKYRFIIVNCRAAETGLWCWCKENHPLHPTCSAASQGQVWSQDILACEEKTLLSL